MIFFLYSIFWRKNLYLTVDKHMDLFNMFKSNAYEWLRACLWCLDELPVRVDSERWEEKGGEMNLNGGGVTCGSRKQKKHEHQEKITSFDRRKVLSEYEQSLALHTVLFTWNRRRKQCN